jgi:hypothetical protein
MSKRVIAYVSILTVWFSTSLSPVNAIENGQDVSANTRVVPIFHGKSKFQTSLNCSGYLYTSDVVLTAAHCFMFPGLEKMDYFVSLPGKAVSQSTVRIKIVDIFKPVSMNIINYNDDFAIAILEKGVPGYKKSKILSMESFSKIQDTQSPVIVSGYGLQSDYCRKNMQECQSKVAPKIIKGQLVSFKNVKNPTNWFKKNGTEAFVQFSEGISICGGDSGGPYVAVVDNEELYIGPVSQMDSSNSCGGAVDTGGEKPGGGYGTFYPAYNYSELINQAVKSAAEWRKNEQKVIACKKGKTEKIFSDKSPKCPRGFKKIPIETAQPVESAICTELGLIKGKFSCVQLGENLIWRSLTLVSPLNGRPVVGTKCLSNELISLGYDSNKSLTPLICTYRESPGEFPAWSINLYIPEILEFN